MVKQVTTVSDVKTGNGLRNTSFVTAEAEVKQRLLVAIDADRGAGKTHFALSAPGPIAFINLDLNEAGVIQKVQKSKRIYQAKYTLPNVSTQKVDEVAEAAGEVWTRVVNDFITAAHSPEIRTLVIDTATDLGELLRLALYGKLTQVISREYMHYNAIYKQLIREVESTDKNLILVHKLKDEYVNDKRTGEKVRDGFKHTGNLVQCEIKLTKMPGEPFPDRYHGLITKCTLAPEIEDTDLQGEALSFDTVMTMVFG